MSVIDHEVLRAIGAKPTGLRVQIPKYMRMRVENVAGSSGATGTVQLDLSYQNLSALILEIPDYRKLRRCVHGSKRIRRGLVQS